MFIYCHESLTPAAMEVGIVLTPLWMNGPYNATWEVRVFYDDDGNANASTVYTEYSHDNETWFEEQAYTLTVGAGEPWTTYVVGGFYSRISGLKAVGAEDVVVGIYEEIGSKIWQEVILEDEEVVSVEPEGTIMYASGDDTKNCDAVIVLVDDHGNTDDLEIIIYMAPNYPGHASPDWHVCLPATMASTAKDRRAAFLVRNLMGRMIKVLGVKGGEEAEDVTISVRGRMPYYKNQCRVI